MIVEIYTKDDCPYCFQAKRFLSQNNIQFTEKKLNVDFTREFLTEKYATARSYPVIVVDGFYVGGYTQLKTLVEQNNMTTKILLNE